VTSKPGEIFTSAGHRALSTVVGLCLQRSYALLFLDDLCRMILLLLLDVVDQRLRTRRCIVGFRVEGVGSRV